MLSPRWRKVLRDLWGNRTRTFLVVLSIAVGVSAVGAVAGSYVVIARDLPANYAQVNPASARIYTQPFDEALLRSVRGMPEVEAAEGRKTLTARLQVGPDHWRSIDLFAIPDYQRMAINKVFPERGAWPPPDRELLIERAAMDVLGKRIGDIVTIETPDGLVRQMRIAGVTHDLNQPSARFVNNVYGYISVNTLEWLGTERNFNELVFVVSSDRQNREHVTEVAGLVRQKIERSGRTVFWTAVPEPGKHPFERFLEPIAFLLGALGLLAVVLSGFLVVNTISALLAQQIRQIGVMKAIGARTDQIMALYLVLVLLLGLLALAVAVPLGLLGTQVVAGLMARMINFDLQRIGLPPWVLGLQVAASLIVPLVAAWGPVRSGTRITVREAINSYGISEAHPGQARLDRLLMSLQGLSRPVLLSLRNTFRRPGRLALTVTTLALGSTIFVAVLSVQASLLLTLDDALQYWQYDIDVVLSRPYRVDEILRQAAAVPGVSSAECWGYGSARRVRPDGTESENIIMIAPPAETALLQPTLLQGRWLLPDDENAAVLNPDVLRNEGDVRVGDEITLKIEGRESQWRVVGIIRGVPSGPIIYANYPYFADVTRSVGRARAVQIVTTQHAPADQREVARAVDRHFESQGLRISSVSTTAELRSSAVAQFNVIVVFLLTMAILLAVVGALGLTGTMSINVLERTREIGVMRAIGATGRTIRNIVITEGSVIGVLSWIVGTILAIPVGRFLGNTVGMSFLRAPLSSRFSVGGAVFWLVAVLLLAALASLLPARNAARLSVRETLAYE